MRLEAVTQVHRSLDEGEWSGLSGKRDRQSGGSLSVEFFRTRRIEPGDHRAALVIKRELLAGDVPCLDPIDRSGARPRRRAVVRAELGERGDQLAALA